MHTGKRKDAPFLHTLHDMRAQRASSGEWSVECIHELSTHSKATAPQSMGDTLDSCSGSVRDSSSRPLLYPASSSESLFLAWTAAAESTAQHTVLTQSAGHPVHIPSCMQRPDLQCKPDKPPRTRPN